MEKHASVRIFKSGSMKIHFLLFSINPLTRLTIDKINIENDNEFEKEFSNLLEKLKSDGIGPEVFHWSSPIGRYDKTSINSKIIADIAKKLVVENGFRESEKKLYRRIKFITGKKFITSVDSYFKRQGLIKETGDSNNITCPEQRKLWEIGLNINNKWENDFQKRIDRLFKIKNSPKKA